MWMLIRVVTSVVPWRVHSYSGVWGVNSEQSGAQRKPRMQNVYQVICIVRCWTVIENFNFLYLLQKRWSTHIVTFTAHLRATAGYKNSPLCCRTKWAPHGWWYRWVLIKILCIEMPHAGSAVVRIDPLRFLSGCHKRWLNQALSVFLLVQFLIVLLFVGATLCVLLVLWYIFCLLVVLVKLSVLAKWLARKTPLQKPNRGEGIVSTKPRPKSVYDFLGLFNVLFCSAMFVLSSGPTWCISYSYGMT